MNHFALNNLELFHMNRAKVLIIDDESEVREMLAEVISERYQAILARDGEEGLSLAKQKAPQAIILDLMMPKINGIEVCQILRSSPETKNIRVIMLTALNDAEQRIKAFNAGADDFVAKPVHPDELLARLEANLRRANEVQAPMNPSSVSFGLNSSYFLDYERHRLNFDGNSVSLGSIEFRIVTALLNNKGQILKRQELVDFVWEKDANSERALDPHITALRKKLKNSKIEVKTVYGVGYSIQYKADEI